MQVVQTLTRKRYDYCLIWGNGLAHRKEILRLLRSAGFLEIVRIQDYRPRSIARFVRQVYSYDYAPFEHLRSKTRYLLRTEPRITVVFARNTDPMEEYRGEGPFRHLECLRIKALKEEIRDQFNSRVDGKRSEEHVIHASDSASQTDHMLKLLGYKAGLGFLQTVPNPVLSVPYYLRPFSRFRVRSIPASALVCSVVRGMRGAYWIERMGLRDTPHFRCLCGDVASYEQYLEEFIGGPLTADYSVQKFLAMSSELAYLQSPYASSYVLVRALEGDRYLILDGVHRASILAWRRLDRLPVAIVE